MRKTGKCIDVPLQRISTNPIWQKVHNFVQKCTQKLGAYPAVSFNDNGSILKLRIRLLIVFFSIIDLKVTAERSKLLQSNNDGR